MKKKHVAKRFVIASLCLGFAISACSGITLLDNNVVVAEESEALQMTDLVHASSSATVEMAQAYCTDTTEIKPDLKGSREYTGLRISSDEAYKATFKTVFDGNLTFRFRFPETYSDAFYGNFTFHIADVTDDSNCFDITYYTLHEGEFVTGIYVQWKDQIRMATHNINSSWSNKKEEGLKLYKFAPGFLTQAIQERGDRLGILSLVSVGGVLTVTSNTTGNMETRPKDVAMIPIASFDGTYDTSKKANGFVNRESWGLPKISFPNGYTVTVSSSFNDERTTDHGTDVFFASIIGSETYDFSNAELTKDSQMEAFDNSFEFLGKHEATEGKFYLGWQNTETNSLYPDYALAPKGNYEPLEINFDTLGGASLRIDASENGKSGIRFETLFDVEEYEAIKDQLQEFGTLVAYTDTLIEGKDFTFENYKGASGFAKVKNTVGTHEYTDKDGNTYTAYSIAVVDINIENYTRAYSARGYLVVKYADGTTQLIYTDYNQEENSAVIEELATLLRQEEEYNAYTDEEKAIIDAFAGVIVEPENPGETEEPVDSEESEE